MLAASLPSATDVGETPPSNSSRLLAEGPATWRRCKTCARACADPFLFGESLQASCAVQPRFPPEKRVACMAELANAVLHGNFALPRTRTGGGKGSDSSRGSCSDSYSSGGTASSGSGTYFATARVMAAIRWSTCLQSLSVFLMCPTWSSKGWRSEAALPAKASASVLPTKSLVSTVPAQSS